MLHQQTHYPKQKKHKTCSQTLTKTSDLVRQTNYCNKANHDYSIESSNIGIEKPSDMPLARVVRVLLRGVVE